MQGFFRVHLGFLLGFFESFILGFFRVLFRVSFEFHVVCRLHVICMECII